MRNLIEIDIGSDAEFSNASFRTNNFDFSYNYIRPHFPNAIHYHKTYEFEILLVGEVGMSVNSSRYECRAGDFWTSTARSRGRHRRQLRRGSDGLRESDD